jgi:hypothetical protein
MDEPLNLARTKSERNHPSYRFDGDRVDESGDHL